MGRMTSEFIRYAERPREKARLARAFGISHVAVRKWVLHGVPAERVLDVHRVTGLTPFQIRPDLYPDPKWRPKAQPKRRAHLGAT